MGGLFSKQNPDRKTAKLREPSPTGTHSQPGSQVTEYQREPFTRGNPTHSQPRKEVMEYQRERSTGGQTREGGGHASQSVHDFG